MTTFCKVEKRCAVCGALNECEDMASSNSFGSPDLDTRPPEMLRSTIFTWVQRCWKCGYCASDISEAFPEAAPMVRSSEYVRQLKDPSYPDLARSFLCKALLEEKAENYSGAAWSLVYAAWACDDYGKKTSARLCRSRGADMIQKSLEKKQSISEQEGAETIILVDLFRRASRLEEALELICKERSGIKEEILLQILVFQEDLIARKDVECHTISEALGEDA
ncbi:MAG TPA: hypothetical protein PLA80_13865 [Synergistaceae bacterium]|nr:hypothetical protein [Synergistaceae bacterium]